MGGRDVQIIDKRVNAPAIHRQGAMKAVGTNVHQY
jgi:hypothetical protein